MDALTRIRHEPGALDLLPLPDPVAGPDEVVVGVAALADGTIEAELIISDDLPLSRWQEGYARSQS